jgi:hypothetical protein
VLRGRATLLGNAGHVVAPDGVEVGATDGVEVVDVINVVGEGVTVLGGGAAPEVDGIHCE